MDAEAFLDLANQVAKLKMYPYFDLAHAVVCCLAIKEDIGTGMMPIKMKPVLLKLTLEGECILGS